MYPTRGMLDYMNEMNRLFPGTGSIENDISTPSPKRQLPNQSMAKSSSSTDTSPDSFYDTSGYRFSPEQHLKSPVRPDQSPAKPDYLPRLERQLDFSNNPFEPFQPQQIYETPFVTRCQRPTVGRKIVRENKDNDEIASVRSKEWHTPPNQLVSYDLFPSDSKGRQEFKTMGISSFMSPNQSTLTKATNMSSYASSMCQWTETMSEVSGLSTTPPSAYYPRSCSSISSQSTVPSRFSFNKSNMGPSTSLTSIVSESANICTFCRKNGETPVVYTTHMLKERVGRKYVVMCPILRSHVCSTCGASGDNAHTISYCPVLRSTNYGKPLQSTTVTLKNTRVKSNGCLPTTGEIRKLYSKRVGVKTSRRIVLCAFTYPQV